MHFPVLILALFLATSCTVNSVGEAFDDSRNESLAKKRVGNANPGFADANINVTSFDGIVLLTGQVSSADLIPMATAQVEPLRNVRKVHNELTVAGENNYPVPNQRQLADNESEICIVSGRIHRRDPNKSCHRERCGLPDGFTHPRRSRCSCGYSQRHSRYTKNRKGFLNI